jgi:hypothetical protein
MEAVLWDAKGRATRPSKSHQPSAGPRLPGPTRGMAARHAGVAVSTKRTLDSMDKIVMLLSSDWFLPYWNKLGIGGGEEEKSCLQKACREIVRQIMAGAHEYYNVSFSPERLQVSNLMLNESMRRCRFPEDAISQVVELINWQGGTESIAWVLSALTMRLLMNDAASEDPLPDPGIRDAMAQVHARHDLGRFNFQELCLRSTSHWDRYLRGLTPDLPGSLADYLSERLLPEMSFRQIWTDLSKELTPEQQDELRTWYRRTAETSMGLNTHEWPAPWGKSI